MQRLLVVYATVEGQSQKIADRIGEYARAAGFDVVEFDAKGLRGKSPPDCDAVIFVAPVHAGRHARSVTAFVQENRDWLLTKPSAFLSVSLSAASFKAESQRDAQNMLDGFLAACDWKPDLAAPVAGALAYSKYGWLKRYILRAKARGEGGATDPSHDYEYTDWEKLRLQIDQFLGDIDHLAQSNSQSRRSDQPVAGEDSHGAVALENRTALSGAGIASALDPDANRERSSASETT